MSSTVFGFSYDCTDAVAVAAFWAAALGREVAAGATEQDAVVSAGADPASGPRLAFHKVPEAKTVKNRLHLDLLTTDLDAESARLIGLGASKVGDIETDGARWRTFADIEGNEFDLIAG